MKREIIARMVNKDGKLNGRYASDAAWVMVKIVEGKSYRFHCRQWSGSYSHRQLVDNEYKVTDILNALGIPYTKGNDAPRCGQEGFYVEAVFDGRNSAVRYIRSQKDRFSYVLDGRTATHLINRDLAVEVFNEVITDTKRA